MTKPYSDLKHKSFIWMTGDPKAKHQDCCAFFPMIGQENGDCEGVMIVVYFGEAEISICRRHLDLFGDMILHTRRLRERDVDTATERGSFTPDPNPDP